MTTRAKPAKHYTATAYIFSDSAPIKTLLVHHKKFGNWIPPGGHQEAWENPVEAIIREVREETGLDVSSYLAAGTPLDDSGTFLLRPNYLVECDIPPHGKDPAHFHLDQVYVIRIPEQPPAVSRESHAVRWYTLEELDALPMFNNVRLIISQEMSQL